MRAWLLLLAMACGGKDRRTEPAASAPDAASVAEPAPVPVSAAETAPPSTPAALYESCRARVENPQAESECTTDADCKTAGCGSEVCTTVAAASSIMSTCEDRLCFKVLNTCACREGSCSWDLKDTMPVAPMPRGLPPTTTPEP